MAWLPMQPAHAADDGTLWRRADQQQHEKMREGADAYRKRDYANAERAWKDLPGADAAYNRGNAFAQAGKYQDAIAAYDEALRQQPAMADAIANRKVVLEEMKRKPPPQQQNKNQDKQQKNNSGNSQSNPKNGQKNDSDSQSQNGEQQNNNPQNDKSSQDGQQQQPQPQGQQPSPPSQGAQPQPKPDDAEAQRKADAEQRARMEEALRKAQEQKNKGGAKGAQQRDETPAERERRQASDAWLRRVQDDPGGLLRAKFRLEYERRQETGER
jgi:Ca-activated chloride channel family protein